MECAPLVFLRIVDLVQSSLNRCVERKNSIWSFYIQHLEIQPTEGTGILKCQPPSCLLVARLLSSGLEPTHTTVSSALAALFPLQAPFLWCTRMLPLVKGDHDPPCWDQGPPHWLASTTGLQLNSQQLLHLTAASQVQLRTPTSGGARLGP